MAVYSASATQIMTLMLAGMLVMSMVLMFKSTVRLMTTMNMTDMRRRRRGRRERREGGPKP